MAEALDPEDLWERAWAYHESRKERFYPLQPENWYTGICPDGRQLLAVFDEVNAIVCWLDGDGRYQGSEVAPHGLAESLGGYWQKEDYPELHEFFRDRFGYRDGPIGVRPFDDRSIGVAIKPFPYWLFQFILDPYELEGDRLARKAAEVEEWIVQDDTYVLEAWGNTYFIDSRDGHCTAS